MTDLEALRTKWLSILIVLSSGFLPGQSEAIVIRGGDYDVFGSTNYQRYTSLADQVRFETVGNIQLYTPVPALNEPFQFQNSCTGTLISASVVLTAAHCFESANGVNSFDASGGKSSMPLLAGQQVFFAAGRNLRTDANYASTQIDYALQFDRLSIHPSYRPNSTNSITYGADLALLRVAGAPWLGTVPTNYLPIYSSSNPLEASNPPSFAITIGYGNIGNGNIGEVTNSALERRAALTEVDYDVVHPNTLTSTFYNPREFNNPRGCGTLCNFDDPGLFPSNFLQGAPGQGDSGGPLILNLGSGSAIVGVVQGGGSVYGTKNWWTRVSSFSSWIESESELLGNSPVATVSGGTISAPFLPSFIGSIANGIVQTFGFFGGPFGVYVDPPPGIEEELIIEDGPPISALFLPEGFGIGSVWTYDIATGTFVDSGDRLTGGQWLLLTTPSKRLRLKGLHGEDDLTLGLKFQDFGLVSLRWESITAVPEPSTYGLICVGILMILGLRFRARFVPPLEKVHPAIGHRQDRSID